MKRALLLLALAVGCTVDPLPAVGRPCNVNTNCGPGAICDPVKRSCVLLAPSDGPARTDADAGRPDTLAPDMLLPDLLAPDAFVRGDGGCPSGMSECGPICANLKTDFLHCGACNTPCPATADRCVDGKCVCGATGAACPAELNCVGGKCACLFGPASLCPGCCTSAGACLKLASQSAASCGTGGAACKACDDGNPCTSDACNAGVCKGTPLADGTACTVSDNTGACHAGQCCGCRTGSACLPGTSQAACGSAGGQCEDCDQFGHDCTCAATAGNRYCGGSKCMPF